MWFRLPSMQRIQVQKLIRMDKTHTHTFTYSTLHRLLNSIYVHSNASSMNCILWRNILLRLLSCYEYCIITFLTIIIESGLWLYLYLLASYIYTWLHVIDPSLYPYNVSVVCYPEIYHCHKIEVVNVTMIYFVILYSDLPAYIRVYIYTCLHRFSHSSSKCMYSTYALTYICTCACEIYVCSLHTCVALSIALYIRMYVCTYICMYIEKLPTYVPSTYISMYVCKNFNVYLCVCLYICT